MSTPYIAVAVWDDDVPLPDDGDDMDAASFAVPMESCLDRTEALRARIGGTGATEGVSRLRRVANFAALTALAVVAGDDGAIAMVDDIGIYEYRFASAAAVHAPQVINGPAGVGRWLAMSPAAAYSLVALARAAALDAGSPHVGPAVDVIGAPLVLGTLAVGDVVELAVTIPGAKVSGGTNSFFLVERDIGGGGYNLIPGGSVNNTAANYVPVTLVISYVVATAGVHTIRLSVDSGGGVTTTTFAFEVSMLGKVYRP
jgi:hypothetical protein